MFNKIHSLICLGVLISLIIFISVNIGCQFKKSTMTSLNPLPKETGSTVVLGFRPAVSQGGESGMIRSPLSGTVFMAEPVPADVPNKMTTRLFSRLKDCENFELIEPSKIRGLSPALLSSDGVVSDLESYKRIGRAFSADAVIVGYIYRWRERIGSNYSADSPASAAFDLYMLRSEDGAILWKAKFDRTQAPLSDNIFDFAAFFKGKGKWMTVESLAFMGLTELLDNSLPDECR